MSLDVYLSVPACAQCGRSEETVYSANITHNLGAMAESAGIYGVMWRPEEHGMERASQLIGPLRKGLAWLEANPDEASKHNAPNGWGLYKHFVPFVENYLRACERHPDAKVSVSR